MINIKAGVVVTVGNVLYLVAAIALLFYHRPLMFNDLIAFASQYEFLEKKVLEELALPYAVMDMQGRMIWSNRMFSQLTGKDPFYRKNVSTIFPDITANKLPGHDGKDITEEPVDKRAKAGMFLSFQNPIEIPGVSLTNLSAAA